MKVDVMSAAITETETVPSRVSMSAEELLALSNEKGLELVDGQLVEHRMGFGSSHIALHLAALLFMFNRDHPTGWVQSCECGFKLPLPGGDTVRKPDVAFVSFQRLPAAGQFPDGYPAVAPDLAVEVVSPNDLFYEVETKLKEYLQAGVRLIWIINPSTRSVQICRQDGTSARLSETDELDGEDVLPGFRCSISSLLEVPHS